ncbi:putative monooxygenase [Orenia metallireducens]|jgi:putative monooxygenase|uniref:Putative monooxygenase n=1 Tax=Orenia metallireducens TaxID=1413210 RepID=A0A285I3J7_9FIRM|nr:cupin domain-containing protein [Orenia metallireducens]PRX23127.1 putative monooxygenase [Orenia metallireducens]SNY42473.1 putative monooxygenase [Orenia metallireducens]
MSYYQEEKIAMSLKENTPLLDKGGEIHVLLSPKNTGNKNLIMGLGKTPVNEKVLAHVHSYSEECFYVIQGQGTLHLAGDESIEFEEGMAVRVPQGVEHWVENTGDVELQVIFSSAPLAPTPSQGHQNKA